MEGKTQEAAAAAAGMSVRSARKWERRPGPAQLARPRHWRTRRDPFAEVFTSEVIPLLETDREGVLEAKTILTELERRHPGQFGAGQLRTLQRRLPCHTVMLARVRRWSTIRVQGRTYSVPARLIGEQVRILVHADRLDVYYRERAVASLPRLRARGDARIDYHHVIFSLVRKPGAFARYRWREELFPSLTFRRAYDALLSRWRERADREYVRVLHLAALNGESTVEEALTTLLERAEGFDAERVRQMVQPPRPPLPELVLEQPDPSRYDALLSQVAS